MPDANRKWVQKYRSEAALDLGTLCGSNIRKVTQNGDQSRRLSLYLYRTHIHLAKYDLVLHHCIYLLSDLPMQILLPKI